MFDFGQVKSERKYRNSSSGTFSFAPYPSCSQGAQKADLAVPLQGYVAGLGCSHVTCARNDLTSLGCIHFGSRSHASCDSSAL